MFAHLIDSKPMNATAYRPHAAPRAAAGAGMFGLDSGVTLGCVVVDANRPAGHMAHPAPAAGTAGGLVKQLITTH